jgi:nucleoredoxin
MPWTAIPYHERDIKAKLSKKFKVRGIPNLVILDENGKVITKSGVEKVMGDPQGANFPWTPQPFQHDIIGTYLKKDGNNKVNVTESDFTGKFLGLYFSADWCPPCRNFTPKLVSYYNKRKESGKNDFEVIFLSSDKGDGEFTEYYNEMPWLAMPFQDPRVEALASRFGITGYPTLVIVDPEGNLVTNSGRMGVDNDPNGLKFPYYPEPVEDLSTTIESYGNDINDCATLIVFAENCDDSAQADILDAIMPHARILAEEKAKQSEPEMIFFKSFAPNQMGERVRTLTNIGSAKKSEGATLVLLDLPNEGTFYVQNFPDGDVTPSAVEKFILDYKAGILTKNKIPR